MIWNGILMEINASLVIARHYDLQCSWLNAERLPYVHCNIIEGLLKTQITLVRVNDTKNELIDE